MSGDKRSVSTDALDTLGTIIDAKAGRDAIHLAVEPVVAAVKVFPGQDVGFVEGGVGPCSKPLGIVDPFLKGPVPPGERFWLLVYPRKITSLRHVWAHPAFDDANASKTLSEAWLVNFCDSHDCPSWSTVKSGLLGEIADDGYNCFTLDSEYMHFGGTDAHASIPSEFWDHVEIVLGKTFPRAAHFSCSC